MKKIYGLLWMVAGLSLFGLGFPSITTAATTNTGSLLPYIQEQKTLVMNLFDSGYTSVYNELSKTGLSLLKTLDYQSLVCLGVLPAESLLSQLQKDKLSLKTSLSRDFLELENKANALEEKRHLQTETSVDLFEGSNYEQERSGLVLLITTTINNDKGFIQAYVSGYKVKIRQFIIDYALYGAKNKDLVKNISERIVKVQYVISGFTAVETKVSTMYQAMGVFDITSKYEGLKNVAIAGLSKLLDPIIALKVKLNPSLSGLAAELEIQKQATLNQYKLDIDEYFNTAFQKRYDRAKYVKLKEKITALTQKYYSNQRLNCTAILANNDNTTILSLSQEIASVSANITSGIALASLSGNQASIKTFLIDGFKKIYNTGILRQKVMAFQKGIQTIITNLLQSKPANTLVSVGTGKYTLPVGFVFTRSLTLNGSYPEVEVLQKILSNEGLYTGAIGTVFTQATKDALYAYQLQKGILTTASNAGLRGLLGPATRASLNKLLAK